MTPDKYGLLVNIGSLQHLPKYRLPSAANDAVLARAVLSRYGIQGDRLLELGDEKATRQAIVDGFRWAQGRVRADDQFVFWYLGHGAQIADALSPHRGDEADLNDEVILPYDVQPEPPAEYVRSVIFDDTIADLLLPLKQAGADVVVLLDCCFARDMTKEPELQPEAFAGVDWAVDILGAAGEAGEKGLPVAVPRRVCIAGTSLWEWVVGYPPDRLFLSPLTYAVWRAASSQPNLTYADLKAELEANYGGWGAISSAWQPSVSRGPLAAKFLDGGAPASQTPLTLYDWDGKPKTYDEAAAYSIGPRLALVRGAPRKDAPAGLRVALVIGITDWDDETIGSLRGTGNDARQVARALADVGYITVLMTSDAQDLELRPTRANIAKQLGHLVAVAGVQTVLVCFSGHGAAADNEAACLLPSDAQRGRLPGSGLTLENLSGLLATSKAVHRILIVDACKVGVGEPPAGFVRAL